MCYSALVIQDLKKTLRELNVFMDYEEAERIFLLRLDDPTLNISKGFEANFDNPTNEVERRPGEDQVQVTLTRGFWMGKFEVTQGDWKRVMGNLPGEFTTDLPACDDLPVGNVNFAEAKGF